MTYDWTGEVPMHSARQSLILIQLQISFDLMGLREAGPENFAQPCVVWLRIRASGADW